jgi:dCTP deaminase
MGLFVGVGVIESGWKGFLTIEMKNQQNHPLTVFAGQPIAQVVFHVVKNPTGGYSGRYQDQPDEAVRAKITEGYANVNDPQHITAASCGRIG